MGDRTSVTLVVLTSQAKAAQALFDVAADQQINHDNYLSNFVFYEVNYGNLAFLDELVAAGIAFDSYWDAGSEYGPGTTYSRYTENGEHICFDLSDDQINPNIDQLVSRLDKPDELVSFIKDHVKATTELPWDSQEEYGKLYRARQLIVGH